MNYNYPNYYGYPAVQQYGQAVQQMQQPQGYSQNYQTQQNQDERIWVQGEGAAQAYLVAPNAFVRLWDSLSPVFYEKRADQSGRPYMETFEYKRKGSAMPSEAVLQNGNGIDYAERIRALEARIEVLEGGKNNDAE